MAVLRARACADGADLYVDLYVGMPKFTALALAPPVSQALRAGGATLPLLHTCHTASETNAMQACKARTPLAESEPIDLS